MKSTRRSTLGQLLFCALAALAFNLTYFTAPFASPAQAAPQPGPVFVVNSTADTNDGECGDTHCTLREAISAANAEAGVAHTINFNLTYPATINVAGSLPTVSGQLTIQGPGAYPGGWNLTVNGNASATILYIASGSQVSISGLKITNGRGNGYVWPWGNACGGGIYNQGTLTLSSSAVMNNRVTGVGAGIANLGTLTVNNSYFSGNRSENNHGGALFNSGTLNVTGSLFTGNSVLNYGAVLYNFQSAANATFTNSTFSGNSAFYGGVLDNIQGNVTFNFSTLVNNSGTGSAFDNYYGHITFRSSILANNGDNCYGETDSWYISAGPDTLSTSSCGGMTVKTLAEMGLSTLGDYGGPFQTVPLLPGSAAAGNANNSHCTSYPTDARGVARPATGCDSGAFQTRGFTLTLLGGDNQSTLVNTAFPSSLRVGVTSVAPDPVEGGTITFTPPASGASASLTPATPVTIAAGQVAVAATANENWGAYNVVASTRGGVAPLPFHLANLHSPNILSSDQVTFTLGAPSSFTVQSTGYPTPTLTRTGALPAGITFTQNGFTASLSGSPAIGSVGVYPLTLGAANGISPDVTQPFTLTVIPAHTATALSSSANPSAFGQTVTFTATVSVTAPSLAVIPTGAVTFQIDGSDVPGCVDVPLNAAGKATCQTSTLAVASHPITVTYPGNASFQPSSATLTQVVNKANTTTALTSTANPSVYGQPLTFTAFVTTNLPGNGLPTGTVTFQANGSALPGCTAISLDAAGQATCPAAGFTPASYAITAAYSGSASYNPSTGSLTQQVNKANTTTTLVSSVNPSVYGQAVTFTATVSVDQPGEGIPTGAVTFQANGSDITGCMDIPLDGSGIAACTTSALVPNSYTVNAAYSGSSNYNLSSASLVQGVNAASTTTTLLSSANPSVYGQVVTFSASVQAVLPSNGFTPDGSVTFQADGSDIPGCVAVGLDAAGEATCQVGDLPVGSRPITAVYSGSSRFNPSNANLTQAVSKASTTASLATSANPSAYGQTVTFTVTVSAVAPSSAIVPSETVTFQSDGSDLPGCVSVSLDTAGQAACQTSDLSASEHLISASYAGSASFDPSSVTLSQLVNKADTTTVLVSSVNPSVYGQALTFTATVTTNLPGNGIPTGTVTLQSDGVNLPGCVALSLDISGQAACPAAGFSAASHAITAAYSSSSSFNPSSAALDQQVDKANTTTVLASSVNPSMYGQSVTFTATVSVDLPGSGALDGTVTFQAGGSAIAGCEAVAPDASGLAACTTPALTPAAHAVTANYSGSASFNPSSGSLTQTVDIASTTTNLVSSLNPSNYGQAVTFTATVQAVLPSSAFIPDGTIVFQADGEDLAGCDALALDASGQATCQTSALNGASHAITAAYGGNTNFNPSSAGLTQQVDPASTTTVLLSSANPSVFGQGVAFTAAVSAPAPTPTGTVQFSIDGLPFGLPVDLTNGSALSSQALTLTVGSHSVSADYTDGSNYTISSAALTQLVDRAAVTAGLTSAPNPSVFGQMVTFTATLGVAAPGNGVITGTVTFLDANGPLSGCADVPLSGQQAACATNALPVGVPTITVTYPGSTDFLPAVGTVQQIVDQAASAMTLVVTPNPVEYNQAVVLTATVAAVAPGAGLPSGEITFYDGSQALGQAALQSGQAILNVAGFTVPGPHTLTAAYAGDVSFLPAVSDAVTLEVGTLADVSAGLTAGVSPTLAGQPLRLGIGVTNLGPTPAQAVTAHLQLPDLVSFLSAEPGCSESGGLVTCDFETLPAGAEPARAVTVTVSPLAVGASLPFTVTLSAADPDPVLANNTAILTVPVVAQISLPIDPGDWITPPMTVTPPCGPSFLGEFGNQAVTLNKHDLAPHAGLRISFDLHILRSWDGNTINSTPGNPLWLGAGSLADGGRLNPLAPATLVGPDIFDLRLLDRLIPLLHTSFSNWTIGQNQAYPGSAPSGDFPAQTGAYAVNSLCYQFGERDMDATYRLSFALPHTEAGLALQFQGLLPQDDINDESWGLSNLNVTLLNQVPPRIFLPFIQR